MVSLIDFEAGVIVDGSGGASAQINIVRRSITQVAPEGFVFSLSLNGFDTPAPATGEVYDRRLHELYYQWDFDDHYDFAAPQNLIPQFRDAGVSTGAKVAHVFRESGNYTVSCTVLEPESGKSATASLTITVGDPEVLFAGRHTLYVDPSYRRGSPLAAAPAGAQLFSSLKYAMEMVLYNSGPHSPKRIMLARGQAIPAPQGTFPPLGGGSDIPSFCIVAAPGPGARPAIDMSAGGIAWNDLIGSNREKDHWWQGIELIGGWDSTRQSGAQTLAMTLQANPPVQTLFDDCLFDGFDIALYPLPTGQPPAAANAFIFINDCVMTNWRSCAILSATANFAITGCRLAQHVDALSGYRASGNQLISPIRLEQSETVIFQQNDVFSRTGWFENTPGIYTTQPCFRGNSGGREGAYYNVSGNMMEGGFNVLAIESADGSESRAINAVVERNILIGSHDCGRIVQIGYGGTTIRNNIGIIPDVSRYVIPTLEFAYYIRQGDDARNLRAPQRLYQNTFINLLSDANAPGGSSNAIAVFNNQAGYTDLRADNNVNHQPNQGIMDDAPFDINVLWSPRYTHYQDDRNPRDTSKATPPTTIALYHPAEGSAALGSALNGDVAHDDFFGTRRPVYPSRGAFEAL